MTLRAGGAARALATFRTVARHSDEIEEALAALRAADIDPATISKLEREAAEEAAARCATGHSFDADTLVAMADGSRKPISRIRVGDRVESSNPRAGGRADGLVTRLFRHDDTRLTDVTVKEAGGAASLINTTQHHRFWDVTSKSWVEAEDLRVGHVLRTLNGTLATVKAVRSFRGAEVMFDLTVESLHTYYVLAGKTPILVHNTGPSCGLFTNTMPGTLERELALADELGVKPSRVGTAGFDSAVSSGTVKWAVREDGRLVVVPKFVNGQEISHAVLTRGAPVRAAGEADIAGSAREGYFGLDINNHSGHFLPSSESLQVGRNAFAAAGIRF